MCIVDWGTVRFRVGGSGPQAIDSKAGGGNIGWKEIVREEFAYNKWKWKINEQNDEEGRRRSGEAISDRWIPGQGDGLFYDLMISFELFFSLLIPSFLMVLTVIFQPCVRVFFSCVLLHPQTIDPGYSFLSASWTTDRRNESVV